MKRAKGAIRRGRTLLELAIARRRGPHSIVREGLQSRVSFFFRRLSIRHKLQAMIMATVAAALVFACGALLAFAIATMRDAIRTGVGILAQVIGENSTAALSFNDAKAAAELLQGLKAQPSITRACIYSARGAVFASYTRPGLPERPFQSASLAMDQAGFNNGQLFVFHAIRLEREPVGAICAGGAPLPPLPQASSMHTHVNGPRQSENLSRARRDRREPFICGKPCTLVT